MGKPGFPTPLPIGGFGRRSRQEDGETGLPHAPARGRVWEGQALTQGDGETGLPHLPTWWEGLGGRCPQEDGETGLPHLPTWWEGLGGLRSPRNNLIFIMDQRSLPSA